VGAFIGGPRLKERHRALGVTGNQRADAALGAKALRQLILRSHGKVEVLQSALSHEQRVRQIKERRHADADQLVARMFRSQRSKEDLDSIRIRGWQVCAERIGNVPVAVEELQRIEPAASIVREGTNREAGKHARDVTGQAPHERAREERLEGLSHVATFSRIG
jgi:hypothetical protein